MSKCLSSCYGFTDSFASTNTIKNGHSFPVFSAVQKHKLGVKIPTKGFKA